MYSNRNNRDSRNPSLGPSSRNGNGEPNRYRSANGDVRAAGAAGRPNVVGGPNSAAPRTSRGLRSSDQIDQIRSRAAQAREGADSASPNGTNGSASAPMPRVEGKTDQRQCRGNANASRPSNRRRASAGAPERRQPNSNRPSADRRSGSSDPRRRMAQGQYAQSPAQQRPRPGRASGSPNPVRGGNRPPRNNSTLGTPPTRGRRSRSSFKLKVALAVVLVLVVGFGIDSFTNGDRIYSGVKIGDVSVAGMTKDEASSAVSAQYAERVSTNVDTFFATQYDLENPKKTDTDSNIEQQISYEQSLSDRTQWTVTGSEVDAELNIGLLVDEAFEVGRSNWGPIGRVLSTLFGYSIDPVCSFNDSLLDNLRDQMTAAVGTKRVNYDIKVEDGVASVTDGNEGDEVTREWLIQHLNNAFLGSESASKDVLETEHQSLQIREADAQKVADTVNRSISSGATFTYEGQSWTASRSDLGAWIVTAVAQEGGGWKLLPSFNADSAKHQILSSLRSNLQEEGLTVTFDKSADGSIAVSTTAQGSVPLAAEAVSQMNETFFTNQERTQTPTIEVQSTDIPSSLSLEDAYSFGLIGEISSFTTQYSSGAEARVNNIHTAANLLNNSICKAGEKWSFNDIAGEATEDKGYQNAHAIVSGSYSDAIGGGICQVATTVFNSVYLAGYPVPRRYNHTLYIESYPKGRDAAIAYPDMDLVWQNDTSSDVLLVMSYTSTSVTCTLIGVSPQYQVSTEYGEWQAGQAYSTTYKTDDTLAAGTEYVESTGVDGSSITIVRTVKDKSGNVLHTDEFTSNYSPKNKVIVKGTA